MCVYFRRPSLDFARRGFPQPSSLPSMNTSSTSTTSSHQPAPIQHQHSGGNGSSTSATGNQQQQNNNNGLLNGRQHAEKRAQYKDGPKFGLKSMISMDDMPELFASVDSKSISIIFQINI